MSRGPRVRLPTMLPALPAFLLALAVVTPLFVGCGGKPADPWANLPGPPRVVTTFPPLECFVRNVAPDHVGILSLATTNGPHHYDPTVEETKKLRRADLFFLNGLVLDDRFAVRMARNSNNPRLEGEGAPGLVNLGERLLALKEPGLVDPMAKEEGHDTHDHHGHHHGEYDPHIWLGIPQAIRMVECIRDELKKVDPAYAAEYDRRAEEYVKELHQLHEDGKALLKDKKDRSLVTNHDSLHYFAKSFGLKVVGVIQLSPGSDPGAKDLKELVDRCAKEGVRVVATEPQFRQKGAAQTLLQELRRVVPDAEIVELDPLETVSGDDVLDRGWYVRRMKANLMTLAKTLR